MNVEEAEKKIIEAYKGYQTEYVILSFKHLQLDDLLQSSFCLDETNEKSALSKKSIKFD